MATISLAMWLLQADPGSDRHLVVLFIGVIAAAFAVMAVILIAIAVKALKTINDFGATAQEVKLKFLPLLDEVMEISRTSRIVLQDAAPKVKRITENLVKTSDALVETTKVARGAMQQVEVTVTDANVRARRQVVRFDGMVTAALTTTAEVVDTVIHGIRVPAQKLAVLVTQARVMGEGLMAKAKSMVDGLPFGTRY